MPTSTTRQVPPLRSIRAAPVAPVTTLGNVSSNFTVPPPPNGYIPPATLFAHPKSQSHSQCAASSLVVGGLAAATNSLAIPPNAVSNQQSIVYSFFNHPCLIWLRGTTCSMPSCHYAHRLQSADIIRGQLQDGVVRGRRIADELLPLLYAFIVRHSEMMFEPYFGVFCAAFAQRGQLTDARLDELCGHCVLFKRPHLLRCIVDALERHVGRTASDAVRSVVARCMRTTSNQTTTHTQATGDALVDLMLATTDEAGGAAGFVEPLSVLVQWQVAGAPTLLDDHRSPTVVRPYRMADAAISIVMAEAVRSRNRWLMNLLIYVFQGDAVAGSRQPPELWMAFHKLCIDLDVGGEGNGGCGGGIGG